MALATKDVAELEAALGQGDLWAELQADVDRKLRPLFKRALLIGAALGAQEKPATAKTRRRKALELVLGRKADPGDLALEAEADWLTNTADEYVANYVDSWWNGLKSTAQQQLRESIFRAIANGGGSPAVARDLEGIFGRRRAETIAVTEVTRLMGQGAQLQYQRAGFDFWEWRTANDARVDPVCQSMAGGGPYYIGQPFAPAHPRCRCWPVPTGAPKNRKVPAPPEIAPPAPEPVPLPVVTPGAFPKAGFTSHVDAEAWARSRFPNVTEWTLTDMHLANVNDVLRQLDTLEKRFPEPFSNLRAIGTHPGAAGKFSSSSTWAHAYGDGTRISFNPAYFRDRARIVDSTKASVELERRLGYVRDGDKWVPEESAKRVATWHPKHTGTVEGVVSHEFGHIVDSYYSGRTVGQNLGVSGKAAFRRVIASDGTGLVRDTFDRMKATRAVGLSQYAKQSEAEKFAEGFAQMIHAPRKEWNAYTRRVDAFLSDVGARSTWYMESGDSGWQWLGDVPYEKRYPEGEALGKLRKRYGYGD